MYEVDFQDVDLHDKIHTLEVDWMSNKPLPVNIKFTLKYGSTLKNR